MHNLYFYNTLMERIRVSLQQGKFNELYRKLIGVLDKRI